MASIDWNDELVARLTRAWMAGDSASKIADELGQGLTRNAVMGKVNRLGLTRNPKLVSNPVRERKRPANAGKRKPPSFEALAATSAAASPRAKPAAATAAQAPSEPARAVPKLIKVEPSVEEVLESERVAFEEALNPTAAAIYRLRPKTCHWPLGDPKGGSFRFCGERAPESAPYCSEHAEMAYKGSQAASRPSRSSTKGSTVSSTQATARVLLAS